MNHPFTVEAIGQELLQGSGVLAGKFPAHQGHPATAGEGQQRRFFTHRQDQPGRCRVIARFDGFIEVETAQQLGRHDLHLAIGLNQHLAIAGESF